MNNACVGAAWSGSPEPDDQDEGRNHQEEPEDEHVPSDARGRTRARFRRRFNYRRLGMAWIDHFASVTKSLFIRLTRRV
jgi:hypothetical protein